MTWLRGILLALGLGLAAVPAVPLLTGGSAAVAQDAGAIDYTKWEKDATSAEATLEADRASNEALEQLRARIVDWRTKFSAAQTANQERIGTVRSQITALGPAPAEGETEAEEIAQRRAELNDQLAKLQAPGIAAVEAYQRADGIIRQIDSRIRARQANELLKLSPTPLNPINWPAGYAVLTQGLHTLWAETDEAWNNPARRKELNDNLPIIGLLLAIAALLTIKGPGFVEGLTHRLQSGRLRRVRNFAAAMVSLGQMIAPVVGMVLLVQAIIASGMTGIRSTALVLALPVATFGFFAARWLASWLFPTRGDGGGALTDRPAEARFHAHMIGLVLGAEAFRQAFITEVRPPLSMAAQSVWAAPLVFLVAIFLFRLGLLLRRGPKLEGAAGEEAQFRSRLQRFLGTAVVGVSVLAPLLAAVGYVNAANAVIWPTAATLGLLATLILLQRFLSDIYLIFAGDVEEGRQGLVPVLLTFLLAMAALPLLALIWGARTADLSEFWVRIVEGVKIGDVTISPTVFFTLILVFVIGVTITRLIQGALKSSVLPRVRLDKGSQNALVSGVGYVGIFLSALIAITTAGIDLSSLAIVAGALSVGIGFGLQNIVSNFVSGIILLIERPISEGDMIEVGGKTGIVRAISVRSTRIETFDRTDVIVPNADLVSGVVTNWTRGHLTGRLILPVGVGYGSDTRKVQAILQEIADAHPLVMVDPAPKVFFIGFGADSLNFEIRMILANVNLKLEVQSDLNHQIATRFADEKIEIPFAQRDLWIRNPETLFADRRGRRGADTVAEDVARDEAPSAPPSPPADPARINNDPRDDDEKDRA